MIKEDWELEQERLTLVYQELLASKQQAENILHTHHKDGIARMSEIDRESSIDLTNYADQVDSFAQIEMRNREIDQLNFKYDTWSRKLEHAKRLLESPYFARIDVRYENEEKTEEFYLGVNSFVNEDDEDRVYDWRSPVAELYYNQELGQTSYIANDTKINVDLKKRRQFQIQKDELKNYFDSSVAIEDELLIHALESNATQYMQDITATIQKEQNAIIRDISSQVLMVNGIAGSGKTSAVLQRIAYLLYQERANLRAEEVVLFAPNPVFMNYISQVLPDLGEKNPTNVTMHFLLKRFLDKRFTLEAEGKMLEKNMLNEATPTEEILRSKTFIDFLRGNARQAKIELADLSDIMRGNRVILPKEKIYDFFHKTPKDAPVHQRMQAVAHHLENLFNELIVKKSRTTEFHNRILELTEEQQEKYFGKLIEDTSKKNITHLAQQYLRRHYKPVFRQINNFAWLNFVRILKRNYKEYTNERVNILVEDVPCDIAVLLVFIQHLYAKPLSDNQVKYVLVDEVQDYSPAQMEVIQSFFPRAKFTLLGDENQAIFQTSNTFENIRISFEEKGYHVTQRDLLTSYRSNGPITQLFERLANSKDDLNIVLVREDGKEPLVKKLADEESYNAYLNQLIGQFDTEESTAIITKDKKEAQKVYQLLSKNYRVKLFAQGTREVPGKNINILPISLAKGLEFDNVVVHDASQAHFHTNRDRHLLYTMVSRAMKSIVLPYIDELTHFLGE